ncbi:hypothetical protein M9H77_02862 [Catharanthus roseus]|uniref:Uncharacterized protein n=1 Tax=Catharanthus roseus TaxID=4058 RepID=A0ACC0C9J7_CATRO|nr:hypothetical protein M9H77_02862 [Catharanthus roseus]
MKTAELVIVPSPAIGHLISSVEMAKLLVDQDDRISVTVLVLKYPWDTQITSYTKSLSKSLNPRLKFVMPTEEQSPSLPPEFKSSYWYEFIDSHMGQLRDILCEISRSEKTQVAGVVVDMLCTSMIDVANEFGVPSYVYYTTGAAFLGLVLHLQSLRDDFNEDITEYKDKEVDLCVPTYINPVPASVFPGVMFDKDGCKLFLNQAKRYRETKGIIINTFLELESHAVQALSKDSNIPPVYTIGPLLNLKSEGVESQESDELMILKWLDHQPNLSVVFLCFGSYGAFSVEQVKEIAHALESSGQRFLWSLRRPPTEGKIELPGEFQNFEQVMPEGFLERTSDTGRVIGWAPQMAVLSHPAVGGFVSHCGWNSILESVWYGVPMAAWPIYSEQQVNAFELVKDLKMAVEIKMDYRIDQHFQMKSSEMVNADGIEDGIRCLMDPENEMRNKVKEMKKISRLALAQALKEEGGSSYTSLRCFINNVVNP